MPVTVPGVVATPPPTMPVVTSPIPASSNTVP
jgi:hypothetical protein